MILEGFEIENWSCIKRLSVTDLPPTGIVVLHGPNGTGKTSVLEALRACLMDNKSTSKALERGFPKNSNDKPRVTVLFRVAGTTWKIMKQFNSKESTLHSRTATGSWKLETADASEAHERARQLAGGSDSSMGLHQLLWLTQAEFQLPDPKKFDADVQSRLRAVLGVLQTPLDDRFYCRVREQWSRWFSARSKPGEKPKLKKDCSLDKNLAVLARLKSDLALIEAEFAVEERLIERSSDLELVARDLRRQLQGCIRSRDDLQQEFEQSLKRIEAHQRTQEGAATAEERLNEAIAKRDKRADAEGRLQNEIDAFDAAEQEVAEASGKLRDAEHALRERRREHQNLVYDGRAHQNARDDVMNGLAQLELSQKWQDAKDLLQKVEAAQAELEQLKQEARERAAPAPALLNELEANRRRAARFRADLEAAVIALTLHPDAGSPAPRVDIDGKPPAESKTELGGVPVEFSVRRRAEISIPGWGRIDIARGADARDMEQVEADLDQCNREFRNALAPFGLAADDAVVLDRLRERVAEKKARDPQIQRKQDDIAKLAPHGLDSLRQEIVRLEHLAHASKPIDQSAAADAELPASAQDLRRAAESLKEKIADNQQTITNVQTQIDKLEWSIEGGAGSVEKRGPSPAPGSKGLRHVEAAARERLISLKATAGAIRNELDRMLLSEQIENEISQAEELLQSARAAFEAARLSESETTIQIRLEAAKESARAIHTQLGNAENELREIKGELRHTEGLHQKRAAAAARVEELTERTTLESLESEAYDRLYALFEECREKQLGTVMGPIHDRVVRWMKLLRIAQFEGIRFNDQFLPEKLLGRDGFAEISMAEESTGTIEQLGLMVRLALGSVLATPEEPLAAMLDDPLTHSDIVRLDRMRAVLRSAAAGAAPSAGPLQIFVFTCHPEWFMIDGAKVIDLGKPEVLLRNTQ